MWSQIFAKLLLHHRFIIGPVADVHVGDGVAFEDDEVGAVCSNRRVNQDPRGFGQVCSGILDTEHS